MAEHLLAGPGQAAAVPVSRFRQPGPVRVQRRRPDRRSRHRRGGGLDDRRLPVALLVLRHGQHAAQVPDRLLRARPVALVHHENVGRSPGSRPWPPGSSRPSPVPRRPGSSRPAKRSPPRPGRRPTVSTRRTSNPAASRMRSACGVAQASPPRWPRLAMDLMNTPGRSRAPASAPGHPSSAPPLNGEVGSTASTPTRSPRLPVGPDQRAGDGGLADAGRAGQADHLRVPGQRRDDLHHVAQLRRRRSRPAIPAGPGPAGPIARRRYRAWRRPARGLASGYPRRRDRRPASCSG